MDRARQSRKQLDTEAGVLRARVADLERELAACGEEQAALRESEARHQGVLESVPVVLFTASAEGRFVFLDGALLEVVGYTREAFLADFDLGTRIIHPDDGARVREEWERGLASGQPFEVEHRIVRGRDGRIRWLHVRVIPEVDGDGRLLVQHGVTIDITRSKAAEEALREAHAQLEKRIEARTAELASANAGLEAEAAERERAVEALERVAARLAEAERIVELGHWDWDIPGDTVYRSPGVYEAFGRTPETFDPSHEGLLEMLVPEDRERIDRAVHAALEGKAPYDVEYRLLLSDGSIRHIHSQAEVMFDEAGSPTRMLGTIQNITERKQTEQAIREERDRAQSYLDIAGVALIALDVDGIVVLVNRKGCELLGRPEENIVGHNWLETFIPERDRPAVRNVFSQLMAGEAQPAAYAENRVLDSEGRERLFSWHNTVLRDASGAIVGTLSSGEDITALRRGQEVDRTLARLGTRLAAAATVEAMIDVIREETDALFVWDAHYLAVKRRCDDVFRVLYYVDTMDGQRQFFKPADWPCPDLESRLRPVLEGKPYLLNRTAESTEPALGRFGDTGRVSASLIYVPVRSGERVIGIVSVQSYTPGRYDEANVGLLQRVADMIAPALERAFTEETLKKSEERHRQLLEQMNEGFAMDDEQDRIRFVNDRLCEMLGYTREEIIGRELMSFFDEANRAILLEQTRLRTAGIKEPYEIAWTAKHGGEVWTLTSPETMVDDDGRYRGSFAVITDISARKRAEDALRESEAMLKSLLRAAPVGIGLVANGILGWTNAEMQQMTGYSGEELAGQCSRMLYETDEEFRRVGSEQYAQIEADGVGSAETRFRRKDGRVIDVLLSSAALDFENLSAGVVFTALDITERRRSEKRAIEQDARLAHLERLSTMGEMAAGIAHELNQPLSAIMNYAEACKLGLTSRVASPEELLENVEAVAVQAQRAGGIIQHVRQFTKLHEPARSPEDLRALITEAAQFLEREARVKDVWIRLELPAEPLRVPVDPVLIQQVVVNLLRNGLDAVSGAEVATRVVTVRATPEARGVVVTVRDNGGGVSPEVMGRLFDPFFTTKQLGLGMGLAISRSIVEAHGGSLSAELNPDRGMTFRMTLPTVAEAEAKHD